MIPESGSYRCQTTQYNNLRFSESIKLICFNTRNHNFSAPTSFQSRRINPNGVLPSHYVLTVIRLLYDHLYSPVLWTHHTSERLLLQTFRPQTNQIVERWNRQMILVDLDTDFYDYELEVGSC